MRRGPAPGGLHVLVAIPCLNEEPTVGQVVEAVPERMDGVGRVEVVVFDDGSTDGTAARASAAGAEVIRHGRTLGLGRTFRHAIETAIARDVDVLVQIDGDGQFDPRDIPGLVAPIVEGRSEMVSASRFADHSMTPEMPLAKRLGNRAVAGIVRLLTGRRFHDVSCGFRALSRRALLNLNLFGSFTYTQESFLDLAYKGLEIEEVPVHVRGEREHGESRVASSLWRYGTRSLLIMLRAFVSYRPFSAFLALSLVFFAPGFGLLGFLGAHYVRSGSFSPHIWAGFVGGSLSFLGVVTLVIGLVGDMLVRIRLNQEALLYMAKARGDPEGAPVPQGSAGDDGSLSD